MRYRLQRHDGTDCSATMVPITVLRMVPIQRYRHKFKTYYGTGPSEWLRRERIRRIEEDMEYRVELPLKEVAERNAFGSASNFADFCQKQTGMSPCELKAIGHEKWEKRRMDFWNR